MSNPSARSLGREDSPGALHALLDRLSDIGVGLKFKVLLLGLGALPPLAGLLYLHHHGPVALQNAMALYVAVLFILYYPLGKLLEEVVVLRQARRINAYVEEVKRGRRTANFVLPDEKGDEHDFLRLKRNIFWMVQGLKHREKKLEDTLRELEKAQRQVLESIEYASLIQRSFLPSRADLRKALGEHFLLWLPRDGVGGDAYWVKEAHGRVFLAVFDCTGHGVPGAFLTLIVNSLFDQHLDATCADDPARLLSRVNRGIKEALSQHGKENLSDDGLEGVLLCLDRSTCSLRYAAARGALLLREKDGVRQCRGDKSGLGFVGVPMDQQFANHTLPLEDVEAVYLYTDGVTDQIGGPRNLPFGRSRLMAWIGRHAGDGMAAQGEALQEALVAYKAGNAQRDDITILGFSTRELG